MCFLDGSGFFKEPAGTVCYAFEAFSRLEVAFYKSNRIFSPFKNVLTFLSLFLKSANKEQLHFTYLH